ncbi:MAG: hypothetical protein JWM88_860 [Verrucomicrobia bacterium]|nr:hypothetical protein [Verrucomicrobiota bacterium]
MITNEKVTTFVKGNPVSVACGVLALILIAGSYFRAGKLPEAERGLDEKSTLGRRIDTNIKNGAQLPEQLATITTAREEIETRLVRPDELAKNQQYFYKLETDTGVKLVGLRQNSLAAPKAGAAKANYVPVGYEVVVRGDYAKLLDFIRRVENGPRFCRITIATINVVGGSRDRPNDLTVTLGLDLLGQP